MPRPNSGRLPASEESPAQKAPRKKELSPKRRGELSELAFLHKAASLGFGVAKPYGDSERFDFILISRGWPQGEKCWRVQIKSTTTMISGLYHINPTHRIAGRPIPYLPTEIDFIAAHVVPEDAWFIFPIEDILNRTCLLLRPRRRPKSGPKHLPASGLFDKYRESWHRAQPPKLQLPTITPSVTPNPTMTPAVTQNVHHSVPVTHPGERLAKELKALATTAAELAREIGVPTNRITQILHGTRAITAETALRLAHFFGTTPESWLDQQSRYDLRQAEKKSAKSINALPTLKRDEPPRIA
jgi:addiction module HigA family antidote